MAIRNHKWLTGVLAVLLLLLPAGCPAPNPFAVRGPNGEIIRREYIDPIINDADLTDEEKRQALRDIGITDEGLIEFLIRTASAAPFS